MKPSLHELISDAIQVHERHSGVYDWVDREDCDELAENIIKIVRDYHLVEDKKDYPFGWDGL